MTREECLAYRQRGPYDAMGDFSVFSEKKEDSRDNEVAASQPELSEQNKAEEISVAVKGVSGSR